jgi:D-alanyl-D-alanine dipeptidase
MVAPRWDRPLRGRLPANGSPAVRHVSLVVLCFAGCLVATPGCGVETPRLPPGFVYLRDIDNTIVQDIRYATAANFTGAPVPGYQVGECILLREAAEALKLVQGDLRPQGLSLKVYDCYRPVRAVKAFMQWVRTPAATSNERYWPRTQRGDLVKLGYIASSSIHSRGAAVDLTLVSLPLTQAAPFDSSVAYGPCNAASAGREPDNSLDMGTSFDCFDPMSYTESADTTGEQRKNRRRLLEAMSARSFKNYFREWWHFTYTGLRKLPTAKDFVIATQGQS